MMRVTCILLAFLCLAHGQKTKNTLEREMSFGPEIVARVFDVIQIDTLETPLQLRSTAYGNMAFWNAMANYHPTAADIFGRTRFKRPANEHTVENKNVATMFAIFRIYEASPQSFGGPSKLPEFRKLIREKGYDPDNRTMNMSTPVGIGNREGLDTARLMAIDGWNADGDLTESEEHYRQPFEDYTGYTPMNNPWKIRFPFKWQPLLENNGRGFFFRQEFVTPYAGSTMAFSLTRDEVERRKLQDPYMRSSASKSDADPRDMKKLRRLAKAVFKSSEELTEEQQVLAELFDNKGKAFRSPKTPEAIPSIATVLRGGILGPALDWSFDEDLFHGMGSGLAALDATMVAWKEKRRLDLIRPTGQTMKMLFGDKKFKVWGGPGKKPVMIKAGEWQPYIRTMPHSEFPSGSSCVCGAMVEHALEETKGRQNFPFSFTIPQGTSKFYPGEMPSKDMNITIERLSDWSRLCGESRIWAGVHFKPSVKAGEKLCRGIGKSAYDFMVKLRAGQLDAKWLTWLPKDIDRFWEED